MISRFCQPVWVMFIVCTLLLSACSDFDEMKGKHLLSQAETLMQQDNESQAEQVLSELVARYPGTQSGATASKLLLQIQKQRVLREQAVFSKILDSYQQVFNGYHALYVEYPRSLSALDESGYFFDSTYLGEIVPDGYQAYLWLKSDGSDYRVWCVAKGQERGYSAASQSRELEPFGREEVLKEIEARFQTIVWNDKLVALQLGN